jgi:hypothetical protein
MLTALFHMYGAGLGRREAVRVAVYGVTYMTVPPLKLYS